MPEAESTPEPKPAPRLGSYLLVKALGSGGMSNVFRAVHEDTGSVVAVKVLPRTLAKNVTLLQRFMREAKSAESLDHPNIVAIYDRGFDQDRHYLVLEFVEGRDLHDRVRLNGPLAPDDAVSFIREVAEGLRYAAGQGMIHRDVKPANLLMTPDGHAKIIDLGLALQIDDEDERVTRDGTTVGTVDYMAPEQARDSRQTSERSDIYSLGCTFYYLLTGSPPFPGGGLSDKLARHYKAPIPEVREHRPDVPEALSQLIRRMMEKKPEKRFADYTLLIQGLDALGGPATHDLTGQSFDALIVDDEDDSDEFGLAPTEQIGRRKDDRPPSTLDPLLMAEIVDDDEDEDDRPPVSPKSSPKSRPRQPAPAQRPDPAKPKRPEPAPSPELSLSELAGLDSDDTPAARKPAQRGSSSSSTGPSRPSSSQSQAARRPSTPALTATVVDDDDEDDEEEIVGSGGPVWGGGGELPLKTWIAAGVMVGLAIAIVGFGVMMVISLTKPTKPEEPLERPFVVTQNNEESQPEVAPSKPRVEIPRGPTPVPRKKEAVVKAEPPAPASPAVVVAPLEEKLYPADLGSRLAPPGSSRPPSIPDRPLTVVRRLLQPGNEPQTSSLAYAFGKSNDLVEIADSGPFFEDDCQVAGKARLIRARGGVRPMIKIEVAANEIVKEQAAKFLLGDGRVETLVLEGLDIAVDVRDLPAHQTTLFLCRGGDLTLRNCSLTILNANDPARSNPFSIFRVEEGSKPNRITLDRTTIRGPVRTLVELVAARAELVFDRSVVQGDAGPLIATSAVDKPGRSIYFHRSLLMNRVTLLELAGKSPPIAVRALGTTFARLEAASASGPGAGPGLIATRVPLAGEPSSILDWSGEDNDFVGWPGWLTSGPEASSRIADVEGVRRAWPGSEISSRESTTPWPASKYPDEITPLEFAELAPALKATLGKVASPQPRLRDLTLGSLPRLATPELSVSMIPPNAPGAIAGAPEGPGGVDVMGRPRIVSPTTSSPPLANATGPRPKNGAATKKANSPPPPPGPLSLVFNPLEAPWNGDLGAYLAEKLVPGTPRATVTVRGAGGVYATSPVRLLDGLSISIIGDSPDGMNQPLPTFYPKPGSGGRTMFDLRGGDLAIANLAFSTENAPRPRHWVQVEDGLLGIRRCRFRDPAGSSGSTDVGAVISFVAKGTAPIASRIGPFVRATDRPTARLKSCLIWTAAEAVSAEIGRGAVDLENCLLITGGAAVSLWPSDVARERFQADMILDRCTVAVDKTAVVLGSMAGEPRGPSRPWLVSTRRTIFPRTQAPGTGALLQVDPDSMARGVLFWQSSYDAYETPHFLTSSASPTQNLQPADLKRQWQDLWGIEHTKGDLGPNPRRDGAILRYKVGDKPKPGKIVPSALELDKAQKDLGVDFGALPTANPTKGSTPPPPSTDRQSRPVDL